MSYIEKINYFAKNKEEYHLKITKDNLIEIFGENYENNMFHFGLKHHTFITFDEKDLYFVTIQNIEGFLYFLKD